MNQNGTPVFGDNVDNILAGRIIDKAKNDSSPSRYKMPEAKKKSNSRPFFLFVVLVSLLLLTMLIQSKKSTSHKK